MLASIFAMGQIDLLNILFAIRLNQNSTDAVKRATKAPQAQKKRHPIAG